MHPIIKKYLKAEIIRNTWPFLKIILVLVPVLSIIGMFSTAQNVPLFNQQTFLKNSNYDWIIFSNEIKNQQTFLYLEADVANIISDQDGIFYENSYPIELFLQSGEIDTKNTLSFFHEKNFFSGELTDLSIDSENLEVAISYNTAEKLNVKIGDTTSLIFKANDKSVFFPITVKAILLPKYMEKNDLFGGLVLARYNEKFKNFLDEHKIYYQTATFGKGIVDIGESEYVIFKKDQLRSASIDYLRLPDLIVTNILFPIMGLIIVYMVFSREVNFEINRKMKMIGILLSLGSPKKLVIKMFWIKYLTIVLVSSVISSLIYKYLLFEMYIGEYIPPKLLGFVILIYVLVGIGCIYIGMMKVKRIINNFSIQEIVTVKEPA